MEKLIYALWRRPGEIDREALNDRIRCSAPMLLELPAVRGLRLNLQDADVVDAEGLRLRTGEDQPDAVIQLWVDVAHGTFRRPIDTIVARAGGRIAAWSVLSSTVIPNIAQPARVGDRTPGWSQMCFLRRPARLGADEWREHWQERHTQVAIETQSNFEYVQNLIVRTLLPAPVDYAAIVEECFPGEAMRDAHVFFDAVNDEDRFNANQASMAESCARFIDAGCVDLLPTSQYDLRSLS